MKPNHDFTPERAVAQHCQELFMSEQTPEEKADELADFADRMQRVLHAKLAPQLGGERLGVNCDEVGKRKAASLYKAIGPASANIMVSCGGDEMPLLLSFDYGAALALTELAFGGHVKQIDKDLHELPRSAWLVLESIAVQIAGGFVEAGEHIGDCTVLRTHENVTKIDAFTKTTPCLVWPVSLQLGGFDTANSEDDAETGEPDDQGSEGETSADANQDESGSKEQTGVELPFRIVVAESDFIAAMEETGSAPLEPQGEHESISAALARGNAFSAIPLAMRAVLAQVSMPVAKLAVLKPGDFIPFTPSSDVPLIVQNRTVARGRIGVLDQQVALNVTQIS